MNTKTDFDVEVIDVDHLGNQLQGELQPLSKAKSLKPKRKGKTHKGKFFLASLFVGVGLTAVSEIPLFLFLGLAVGIMLTVDPIYDKIIQKIESL